MITLRDLEILRFVEEHGSITIDQAYKMYFKDAKYGADSARKRLKHLADAGELKYTTLKNSITGERVYFKDKPISAHKLYLLNMYVNLHYAGADNIKLDKEPKLQGLRPDALINCGYGEYELSMFVEVVITHNVNYTKYEELKASGSIHSANDPFPALVVIGDNAARYNGQKLTVKYLDYKLNNFNKTVLL